MKTIIFLMGLLLVCGFVSAGNLCFLKGDLGIRITFFEGELKTLKANQKMIKDYQATTAMLCGYYGIVSAEIQSFTEEQVLAIQQIAKEHHTDSFSLCFYLISKDLKSPIGVLDEREMGIEKDKIKERILVISDFDLIVEVESFEENDAHKKKWHKILKKGKWEKLEKEPQIRSKQNRLVEEYILADKENKSKTKMIGIDAYRIIVDTEDGKNMMSNEHLAQILEAEIKKKPDEALQKELDGIKTRLLKK